MISKKVLSYLDKQGLKYDVVNHRKVYTAYDLAQTLKADLKSIAKTLLIKADNVYVLVIVPAHRRLDLAKLKKALKAKKVSLPEEKVVLKVLKIKMGGLTSFGNLHKLSTLIDKELLKAKKVLLNGGSFKQSLSLAMKDVAKIENAAIAAVSQAAQYKPAKKMTAKKKTKKIKKVQTIKKKSSKKKK